jgi:hypothetical protein
MSKPRKDSNAYIQEKTAQNASGSVKKALDLLKSLKQSSGNPKMEDAVGAGNLADMLSQVAQDFAGTAQTCDEMQQQLNVLQSHLTSTLAIVPQTFDLQTSEQQMQQAITTLTQQMIAQQCPMANTANTTTL